MGIPSPLAELIIHEHSLQPIGNHALSLGRQTILFDNKVLDSMLGAFRLPLCDPSDIEFDTETSLAKQHPESFFVSDRTFWRSLGVRDLNIMDISDYEGADILHDVCTPISSALENHFDFIFDGSVLDNVFDPATVMRNMTRMLKPGGRLICIEMASNLAYEYLIFPPDWFFDYFAYNGFDDCRVYLATFKNLDQLLNGPWELFYFLPKPDGSIVSMRSTNYEQAIVLTVAAKGNFTTWDKNPVQWCYRSEADMKECLQARERFRRSSHPIYLLNDSLPTEAGGLIHCGQLRRWSVHSTT